MFQQTFSVWLVLDQVGNRFLTVRADVVSQGLLCIYIAFQLLMLPFDLSFSYWIFDGVYKDD